MPGLAERIVVMAEKQQAHRMELEQITVSGDNHRANWGLICGVVVALAVLTVSGILAYTNHETTAVILAGADIAALVGVFVYGTQSRRIERQERIKQLEKLQDKNN
jgi:uncharacterized membrane protein